MILSYSFFIQKSRYPERMPAFLPVPPDFHKDYPVDLMEKNMEKTGIVLILAVSFFIIFSEKDRHLSQAEERKEENQ